MEISGPINIGTLQNDMSGHELHLDFTAGFRAMNSAQQDNPFGNISLQNRV
jgi:hypothetical protein